MSYQATVLSFSPVRYYRLGESSGTVATDIGSQALNGTIGSGVTLAEPGALTGDPNTSMLFDGSTGEISAVITGLAISPITVHCWVNPATYGADAGNNRRVLIVSIDATHAYQFAVGTSSDIDWVVLDTSEHVQAFLPEPVNTWYHIAGTYNSVGPVQQLYINGQLITPNTTPSGFGIGTSGVAIGARTDGTGHFSGFIDEVAIHASVLSAANIAAIYQAGIATGHKPQALIGRARHTSTLVKETL